MSSSPEIMAKYWEPISRTLDGHERDRFQEAEDAMGHKNFHSRLGTLCTTHLQENNVHLKNSPPKEIRLAIIGAIKDIVRIALEPSDPIPTYFPKKTEMPMDPRDIEISIERREQKREGRPRYLRGKLRHIENVGWIPTPEEL